MSVYKNLDLLFAYTAPILNTDNTFEIVVRCREKGMSVKKC